MTCKEKSQVLQEPQQTPSEPSQETPLKESEEATEVTAEIESESPGCYGTDSHKWDNKMEVQRLLSGKPDLEINRHYFYIVLGFFHSIERPLRQAHSPLVS